MPLCHCPLHTRTIAWQARLSRTHCAQRSLTMFPGGWKRSPQTLATGVSSHCRAVSAISAARLLGREPGGIRTLSRLPVTPLPKERIEQALSEALEDEAPINLRTVAEKIGLRNKRRLYKGFHDLRRALVAKNRRLRCRRWEPIENALRAAFDETPVPTVTDVARRLGLKSVTRITKRFPDLSSALKSRRRQEAKNLARSGA